jgi:hypothetical protein
MPRARTASSDAIHHPVVTTADVIGPGDVKVHKRDPIDINQRLAEEFAPGIETDVEGLSPMSPEEAKAQYMQELAFNEQPVTVVITPSSDRNAPKHVFCAVQGVGAEVYDPKARRWIRFTYLPVSTQLTVKRKYLEVLAKSRQENFSTREVSPTPMANQDGYVLEAESVPVAPFVVRHDPAGDAGLQWYQRMLSQF